MTCIIIIIYKPSLSAGPHQAHTGTSKAGHEHEALRCDAIERGSPPHHVARSRSLCMPTHHLAATGWVHSTLAEGPSFFLSMSPYKKLAARKPEYVLL